MSGTKNRPHKRRNIILLVLLALLCIGGVELLVCRFAAPELFQRLAAPVAGLYRGMVTMPLPNKECRWCVPKINIGNFV